MYLYIFFLNSDNPSQGKTQKLCKFVLPNERNGNLYQNVFIASLIGIHCFVFNPFAFVLLYSNTKVI